MFNRNPCPGLSRARISIKHFLALIEIIALGNPGQSHINIPLGTRPPGGRGAKLLWGLNHNQKMSCRLQGPIGPPDKDLTIRIYTTFPVYPNYSLWMYYIKDRNHLLIPLSPIVSLRIKTTGGPRGGK